LVKDMTFFTDELSHHKPHLYTDSCLARAAQKHLTEMTENSKKSKICLGNIFGLMTSTAASSQFDTKEV
ncbi:MAG: hypothetical protein Q7U30_01545, partial [Methylicorpusculum sp.]|nr:hypothetical protein [Methylicorpusculum sp.]